MASAKNDRTNGMMLSKSSNENQRPQKILFHSNKPQDNSKILTHYDELKSRLAESPKDPNLLLDLSWAALLAGYPSDVLVYTKRFCKNYSPQYDAKLCEALALAEKSKLFQARFIITQLTNENVIDQAYIPRFVNLRWLDKKIESIRRWQPAQQHSKSEKENRHQKQPVTVSKSNSAHVSKTKKIEQTQTTPSLSSKIESTESAVIPLSIKHEVFLPDIPDSYSRPQEVEAFTARSELEHLSLFKGFEQLLTFEHNLGINFYWYQVETVKKVLKQFRGRVLLADEVGLGKTVEALIVVKEYILRGMANRVLILVPPGLVSQWQEELSNKVALEFATTENSLTTRDPLSFWSQPRILASLSIAKREPHVSILASQEFDIVVVDEAHHLKNRRTLNFQLVDNLKKRFLLLLSATPVQNNLIELYNLLTLLKPGLFKTEQDFRKQYVTPGKPRLPKNREALQDLMREVMIRNTRSLVDVKLPPRHATTLICEPSEKEASAYSELSGIVRQVGIQSSLLASINLLGAAGSSPAAAQEALAKFISKHPNIGLEKVSLMYKDITCSAKLSALLELLRKNPEEKKMVFVRYLNTLQMLCETLKQEGLRFTKYDGSMNIAGKDQAITDFRDSVPILLCTESAGEGRNVQFCNTIINFDLPWNPQVLEQRTGRVHRIGQVREVFLFNLALRGTIEEKLLEILNEKLNMFELVVGEMQTILGEIEEEADFSALIYRAWMETTEQERKNAFDNLTEKLLAAKEEYCEATKLDQALFGDELTVV